MNPQSRWRDPLQAYQEMQMMQRMQQQAQQQVPQGGGGVGGFVGGVLTGIAKPFVRGINQAVGAGGQVYDTARMLTAQATDNTEAFKNANQAAQNRYKQFGETGGLLNMGTITNEQETRRGEAGTGIGKIGGNTAMQIATIAPVGKAATVMGKGFQAAGTGAMYGGGEALANKGSLEDVITGSLKSGAVGGVIGAGPLNLLRGGASGTKAAIVGDDVMSAVSNAANKPLMRKAGQALNSAADDLAVKNFRLTPTQLKNFKSKFGEDAGQTIQKYGFNNVDDISTKGIEPLQQQFDEAITGITGVTKDSLQKNLSKRFEQLKNAGPSDSQAIGSQLQRESKALLNRYGDVVDASELNTIRRQFDDLVNYTEKTANPSRYGVNKRMADGIRETLQQSDQSGTLKGVGRELQKLRQLSDNAARQSELGRGSLPLNLPTLLGGGMGAAAGGPLTAVGAAVSTAAINSPTGRRATMKAASGLGSKLSRAGEKQPGMGRGLLARGAAIGAAQPSQQSSPQTLDQALTGELDPAALSQGMGGFAEEQAQSPYSQENLMSDIQRDPKNANNYLEFFSMMDEMYNPKAPKLNATQQQQSNNAISALQDLETIKSSIARDPNSALKANLPGGSLTQRLTGTTEFEASRKNIGDVMARLRSGAAITDDEYKRYMALLPASFDSPRDASMKVQRLEQLLGAFANPAPVSSGLEGALMTR